MSERGGPDRLQAVVFDLWNTLAEWPVEVWAEVRPSVAERLGLTPAEFDRRWWGDLAHMREIGPMAEALRALGASPEVAEEIAGMRRAVTEQGLVPVPGAVETISELRRRGLLIGLITVCTDDVPALWPETPFHGLFDVEVFSCSVGLRKPDPRIYRLACDQLGIEPGEAMFVGDGANDELAGAERVGMTAVLIERDGEDQQWEGRRIRSLPELLELL
ncbi:MAG TPA: HAD-IA family hydrolase [Gaiellaceae bacterium]